MILRFIAFRSTWNAVRLRLLPIDEFLVGAIDSWIFGWPIVVILAGIAFYWRFATPSVGTAIACVSVAAAIFSARAKADGLEKLVWILVLFALLSVEIGSIGKEKNDAEVAQEKARDLQRQNFEHVLLQERLDSQKILNDQQLAATRILREQAQGFQTTLTNALTAQADEHRHFASVVNQLQSLYSHEDEVAASLGGHLVSGKLPTPANNCDSQITKDDTTVILSSTDGDVAFAVHSFPYVVLARTDPNTPLAQWIRTYASNSFIVPGDVAKTLPVLTIDRSDDGNLAVILELHSDDGRLIVKMDRDGYVVNRNNYLQLTRNQSHFQLIDEFGKEVVSVEYLNPKAIVIREKDANLKSILHSCFMMQESVILPPSRTKQ
jgi:hypothetical protein